MFCYLFELKSTVHFDIWAFFVREDKVVGIDDLGLSFMDEDFFIVAGHLFSIWIIDNTIDKVECKKCTFSFLFLFWVLFVFFFCFSFLDSVDGLFLFDRDMYSDGSIKKFSVDTISPPKKSYSKLCIRHPYHQTADYKRMYSTIHDDNMILFESRNNFSFYAVEEVC